MPMFARHTAGRPFGDHRWPLGRCLVVVAAVLLVGGWVALVPVAVAGPPPFDIKDFAARSLDSQGNDYPVAGGHPYEVEVSFSIPSTGGVSVHDQELVKSTYVDSPAGFVGNPGAVAERCTMEQLQVSACPAASLVGKIDLNVNSGVSTLPLSNMVPERGYPAQFGFIFFGTPVVLYPRLRSRAGGFGITVASPGIAGIGVRGAKVVLFGVPSQHPGLGGGPALGGAALPFISNPGDCLVAAPESRIAADSWQHPGRVLAAGAADFGFPDLSDPMWKLARSVAPAATSCDAPGLVSQFAPSLGMAPTPGAGLSG